MGRALTDDEREYVAGLDEEYRAMFRRELAADFGRRGVQIFEDAWQLVMISVSYSLAEGYWPGHSSRWQEKMQLRFVLREARRYVMYGRHLTKGTEDRGVWGQKVDFDWDTVVCAVGDEVVDGVSDVFDVGVYIVKAAIGELSKVLRETMEEFVAALESGEIAEDREEGLHGLLSRRFLERRGEDVSKRKVAVRLNEGRNQLWRLLVVRGMVSGEPPKGFGGHGTGIRRPRRAGVKPRIRLRV